MKTATKLLFLVPALAPALLLAGCQAAGDASSGSSAKSANARTPARPAATPKPALVIPEGTALALELRTTLSSASSQAGDLVVARLTEDVKLGERVALARGSEVRGRVTAAVESGKVKGRARLAFEFDRVLVGSREIELAAGGVDITAGDSKKRDAAIIGGGTAGGAIIGAIADGGKGAAIGAVLGGAAGTGAVLATKGKEVELPSGTPIKTRLQKDLRL
ncbi:MAG: hypothetical protein AB7O37_15180 [Vicinamibacteria bacterium]